MTDAEVESRLERYGRNELATEKATPAWRRFLAQFQDVLVILLLVATGISAGLWAYERDADASVRSHRHPGGCPAQRHAGLRPASHEPRPRSRPCERCPPRTLTVIRNGERRSIPAAEIVPGDIILIEEGDTIPADGRLLESAALQTAEAALTGESLPVSKDTDVIAERRGAG